MINLTPHDIVLDNIKTKERITIPASGIIARVSVTERIIGICNDTGLDIIYKEYGDVENLPDSGNFIVSGIVLEALKDNSVYENKPHLVVYAPDTGSTAIRNELGHIIAVTRLVSF